MHTIRRQNKNEWMVVRVERDGTESDVYVPMFGGLGILAAVRLTNLLNGGGPLTEHENGHMLEACWRYAEENKR